VIARREHGSGGRSWLTRFVAERFLLQIQPLVVAGPLTSLRAAGSFYSFQIRGGANQWAVRH
jgi:hypothetical protein